MCFPIGVGMKQSTTKDYKVINEEIFNPIEKKKEVQHYTCRDTISDINSEAKFADGFDEAIIGYDAVKFRAVYDYDKCLEILTQPSLTKEKMTKEEAHEFMEFNVVGAYVGDFTPLFIHRLD